MKGAGGGGFEVTALMTFGGGGVAICISGRGTKGGGGAVNFGGGGRGRPRLWRRLKFFDNLGFKRWFDYFNYFSCKTTHKCISNRDVHDDGNNQASRTAIRSTLAVREVQG